MITHSKLLEILDYDPETGVFVWKIDSNGRVPAGSVAGAIDTGGYRQIRIKRKFFKAHRLAWLYVHKAWPKEELDHINRQRDDNRICNLREASHGQNMMNAGLRKDNKLGAKGISKQKGRYVARVSHMGKMHYLGSFSTLDDASNAAVAKREELHGEFRLHG